MRAARPCRSHQRSEEEPVEASEHEGGRGLRRNAIGLPGLIAQSLGVTAPEISAVVIAAVVASKVGGFVPAAFWVAGIGAIGLALVYGRFARFVPSAGGTYAIVRAGLGRDVGFFAGWTLLAVGIIFVPGLLIAAAFLLQNFFSLVAAGHPFLYSAWWGWALLLAAVMGAISWLGIQISARMLLTLTAIGVTFLLILDVIILAKGGANGWAWSSLAPWSNKRHFGFGSSCSRSRPSLPRSAPRTSPPARRLRGGMTAICRAPSAARTRASRAPTSPSAPSC